MNGIDDVVGKPNFLFDIKKVSEEKFQNAFGLDHAEMEWLKNRVQALIEFAGNLNRPCLFAKLVDDEVHFIILSPSDVMATSPIIIQVPFPNPEYFDSEIGFILANQVVASTTKNLLDQYDAVADIGLVRLFTGLYNIEDAMSEPEGAGIAYFESL